MMEEIGTGTWLEIRTDINKNNTNLFKLPHGANLRNFLKKARSYRAGRKLAEAPTIVLIGDSITGGDWAENFKTYLCAAYDIPTDNFTIHWYGGYTIQYFLPFIEDTLIFPNPDLIIFGEYENMSGSGEHAFDIENIIQLLRDRTTADIAINTWSMTDTIAEAYLADSTSLIDDEQYQELNWYRDIAAIYNCELIDFNESIKNALDAGYTVSDLGMDGPHLSDAGYAITHYPEIVKHFQLSNSQFAQNIPYPLRGKEEIIYTANATKMDLFDFNKKITLTGTWSDNNIYLQSTTVGDTVEIILTDVIGFEILHNATSNASILLKESGGAYAAPSTFDLNSRPLQYITEILSTTYADDWSDWRFKRPFTKGILTANELSDGTLISGQYTIIVNSVVGDVVTCEMFNPSSVSMGTFEVGQTATFTSGNLSFPQIYNGENNYQDSETFVVGDEYEFYIKNNWCDTLTAAEGTDKVFGLERGDYVLKLTITNTTGLNLYGVRLLH